MLRKILVIVSTLIFAFGILFTSVLRTASVKYAFSQSPQMPADEQVLGEKVEIDYYLRYPGKILPDHPLWFAKALRDRLWLILTTNPSRKAELKLLFADKRLGMSKTLFEKDKPEIAFSTLTKAEKYLEAASNLEKKNREKGIDTSKFLTTLAKASLKHRQVIEEEILVIAPADARPLVVKVLDYAKNVYNDARQALQEKGLPVVENPFEL
jgi:hypothetical protein